MQDAASFDEYDFETLEQLDEASAPPDTGSELERRARRAWDHARQLLRQAADAAALPEIRIDVWPWRQDDTLFPFVWARFKRPDRLDCAAHLGVFLSVGGCNCALDLEKDLIDAGDARESVAEVLDFFGRPELLPTVDDPRLRVWTDADNVLGVDNFRLASFEEFMAANRDEGHPWPRLGYRFEPADLLAASEGQVAHLGAMLARLLPAYDALVDSYGGKP